MDFTVDYMGMVIKVLYFCIHIYQNDRICLIYISFTPLVSVFEGLCHYKAFRDKFQEKAKEI